MLPTRIVRNTIKKMSSAATATFCVTYVSNLVLLSARPITISISIKQQHHWSGQMKYYSDFQPD